MAIGIGTAILGSALVGGAASYASSKSAAKKAEKAATYAADQNAALARETRDIITGQVSPWVTAGSSATNALAQRLGLTVAPQPGPAPAPTAGNPLATAGGGYNTAAKATGGAAGVSPLATAPGGNPLASVAPAPTTSPSGSTVEAPDWAAYGASNPDVAAGYEAYLRGTTDGFAAPGTEGQSWQDWGYQPGMSREQFYAQHYATTGQGEGRAAPPIINVDAPREVPYGVRPEDMDGPQFAARAPIGSAPAYDFSAAAFEASPDYSFRQQEAVRALNNYYGARGGLKSGGAIKAILDRASNLAAGEFGDWWNRQYTRQQADRGQFNLDTARGDARYDADRAFTYGRWYDDRGFNTSRFDKQTSDLFGLSGQGLSGVGTIAGANQNALGVIAGSNNQRADAVGSAAIAGANNVNNLIGQGLGAVGMWYGAQNNSPPTNGNPLRYI